MHFITKQSSIISLVGTEHITLESCKRNDIRSVLIDHDGGTQSLFTPATSVLQVPKIKPASPSVNVTSLLLHLTTSEIFVSFNSQSHVNTLISLPALEVSRYLV